MAGTPPPSIFSKNHFYVTNAQNYTFSGQRNFGIRPPWTTHSFCFDPGESATSTPTTPTTPSVRCYFFNIDDAGVNLKMRKWLRSRRNRQIWQDPAPFPTCLLTVGCLSLICSYIVFMTVSPNIPVFICFLQTCRIYSNKSIICGVTKHRTVRTGPKYRCNRYK